MKKLLLLFTILFVSVITTACINNLAIQELNNKAESYMDKGDTEAAICRLKASLDLDNDIPSYFDNPEEVLDKETQKLLAYII